MATSAQRYFANLARRRYGDEIRRILIVDYGAHGVAQATTRRLKPYVDEGWRMSDHAQTVADRIAREELGETIVRKGHDR